MVIRILIRNDSLHAPPTRNKIYKIKQLTGLIARPRGAATADVITIETQGGRKHVKILRQAGFNVLRPTLINIKAPITHPMIPPTQEVIAQVMKLIRRRARPGRAPGLYPPDPVIVEVPNGNTKMVRILRSNGLDASFA